MGFKNEKEKKRFPCSTQLNEDERAKLDNMLNYEKEKIKKVIQDEEAINRTVNDASFIRGLIVAEYAKRFKSGKKANVKS